jgi:hypothetical protein
MIKRDGISITVSSKVLDQLTSKLIDRGNLSQELWLSMVPLWSKSSKDYGQPWLSVDNVTSSSCQSPA